MKGHTEKVLDISFVKEELDKQGLHDINSQHLSGKLQPASFLTSTTPRPQFRDCNLVTATSLKRLRPPLFLIPITSFPQPFELTTRRL